MISRSFYRKIYINSDPEWFYIQPLFLSPEIKVITKLKLLRVNSFDTFEFGVPKSPGTYIIYFYSRTRKRETHLIDFV